MSKKIMTSPIPTGNIHSLPGKLLIVMILSCMALAYPHGSAVAEDRAATNLRTKSEQLFKDGNFKEAFAGFEQLAHDSETDPEKVLNDINNAVNCMHRLGNTSNFDSFMEETIAAHEDNWRALNLAARTYLNTPHHGFMIAGKFERGNHRGGGEYYHATERDRVRALQLTEQAMSLALLDEDKSLVGSFFSDFATRLLANRGYNETWRLQYLTDTAVLPDYDPGYNNYRQYNGAPVDADGKPVFHQLPADYKSAATDGERWRWCLAQAVQVDPRQLNPMRQQLAQFSRHQFGVTSMQQFGQFRLGRPQTADDKDENESGTYALHTLAENETIARLASGIKRFELPDEYNFIKIHQQIVAEPETGYGENALSSLAQIHEDRRQYEKAVEYWQENIRTYGNRNWKQDRLKQIIGNWGRFEPGRHQTAGSNAELQFRFRNAEKVQFTAERINVEKLLANVRKHIKSNPKNLDWQRVQLNNIGYRLVNQNQKQYLDGEVASWEQKLVPRKQHFDRRTKIESPLKDAGAYLITAKVADGNTSRIVLWIADTTIVRKPLSNEIMFYAADAVTGKPIPDLKLDFFGYRQEQIENRGNQSRFVTREYSDTTDDSGMVRVDQADVDNKYQWMVMARNDAGRLAFLGFQGMWFRQIHDSTYNQTKSIVITDRPVYRPGHEMKFKVWFRHAQYDKDETSQFANRAVTLRINNPKGDKVYEQQLTTDEYGGLDDSFTLPSDATLGQYSIQSSMGGAIGGNTFRVEEYKKPEFEVTIDAPDKPVMLGEKVPAKITAKYYFGAPVTEATVKYTITRTDHDARWFPAMPWDWCFGPGYWWYGYDTPWYPGWNRWHGCKAPWPWWYGESYSAPEIISQVEAPIGPDGTIEFEIDTALARELQGDTDHKYSITAEVRDQSRRTIVGSGEVLVARKPFKVFTWLHRGYYQVGDTIRANFKAQTLDKKPVTGTGKLTLLKVTYDENRKPIETPVETWDVNTDSAGEAAQQIAATAAGQYRLSYEVTDDADHRIEGGYLFTIIGDDFESANYRFNDIELVPDRQDYRPGETVKLQINTSRADCNVLLFVRPSNGVYLPPKMIDMKGEKSRVEEIVIAKKDMPNFFVEAMVVADGKVHSATREIVVPPEKRVLNVEVLPSKTKYRPGEKATVDLKLTDFLGKPFQGTTAVSIYDKSVEYISGGSNVPNMQEFFWKWRRSHSPNQQTSLDMLYSTNIIFGNRNTMNDLGVFGFTVVDEFREGNEFGDDSLQAGAEMEELASADKYMSRMTAAPMSESRAAMKSKPISGRKENAEKQDASGPGGSGAGGGMVEPTVRSKFADTAFWQATLNTDANGVAQVKLDMPENLTTWKIGVWSMGHGTKVGQGSAEVVTQKDLIVRLQAPRFFLEKDQVTLSAIVHNYLDSAKQVQVKIELPGEYLACTVDQTVNVTVPAGGEQRVDWSVDVLREGTAKVRMLALTDKESDAMEQSFPVHVHGMLKTESWAGTVRPDEKSGMVSFTVPAERRPDQSLLQVRYSPTLAAAMVDALPYLSDYPYGCTEQTLNRWLPTLVTQKVLIDMNVDLADVKEKRTNLNAQQLGDAQERAERWKVYDRNPVFDETEVVKMINAGVERLADMQLSDGGWGWFSGYGEHSSPHTTATVVHGLQLAERLGAPLPDGMLQRGIAWLKNYQQQEVTKLDNAAAELKPYKRSADNIDALIYMILTEQELENRDMRVYLYRDRNNLSVYAKAVFGIGLEITGDDEKLTMIMRNIEQFVVQDEENETAYLKLPEDNYWWYWYGSDNAANAYYLKLLSRTQPKEKTASRLVKYLLNNRRNGTYWRSTRDTALCIEAFAEYIKATGEDKPDMFVEIWLDGEKKKEVQITQENLLSFDDRLVLAGDDLKTGGHELEIRRRGTGPVYFNAYMTNFTLEDYITEAGLEVKVNRKYFKLTPVEKTVRDSGALGQVLDKKVEKYERTELTDLATVVSGDLVEVELTLISKNDYEYLLFEDMKPAGFEAVEVRSGYSNRGLRSYVEYRDNRVSFFIQSLARGTHSVNYRLRAEIPGRFSALPATATGMYAPELTGNSNEIKLKIVDAESHE